MADSSLLSNQNSLDTYPSFKNLPSIKDNQDTFTIDERDLVEQTNNSQAIDKPQENKQTKKTKSSDPPVLCDICSVWISSEIVYDIHIQGRKHQTQLKAIVLKNPEYKTSTYDELSSRKQSNEIVNNSIKKTDSIVNKSIKLACDTCHVTCNSQQMFDTHIAGKRHQMKLREGIFPISDQSFNNHKSSFSNSKRQQKHFECQLCQKTFREQIHFNRHLNSASHRENTSKNYNPFLTSDNSNLYPSQTNTWTQSTYPDAQLNNPKRLRTYYNPDYSTSHEQISSNFSQDYRSWDYRYYNQSYCQYQSDPNSNPSIYHPSNQTQPLPDYIPVSSHYSY